MKPKYQLYFSAWCFFCAKVARFLEGREHSIEFLDVADIENRSSLIKGGGKSQVPCLRIEDQGEVQWLYESDDIIQYIQNHQLAS